MSEAIDEQRLNDYVDGVLGKAEVAEVERLLRNSPEARETVDFLRSLKQQCAALPEEIEPDRDLWPAISERMAPAPLAPVGRTVTGRPAQPDPNAWLPPLRPFQWAGLAAAAMLLVVSSSALTAWFMGASPAANTPADPSTDAAAATGVALEGIGAIEARYAVQIEQLVWELYENRDRLDEDTVSTIETNLRVIDRAIRSAREALQEDPQNAGVTRMLNSNYRHKLELLQRAQRIIELS